MEFVLNLHLHIPYCDHISYYEFVDKYERLGKRFKAMEEAKKSNNQKFI